MVTQIGEGRKDLVVPHKEYTYRPDNSRRLREDLLSSRARVEEALRYQPTPAMNSRKRTAASDWVPHLGRGVGNLPRDIPSSYQPRTPELKNWLRGSNSAPGGARSDLYY